jgi:hypothetical protein
MHGFYCHVGEDDAFGQMSSIFFLMSTVKYIEAEILTADIKQNYLIQLTNNSQINRTVEAN